MIAASVEEVKRELSPYKDKIFGFFLGNSDGIIYKERVFNPKKCPELVLKSVVKAICSFAKETNISDKGTIGLSSSQISFVQMSGITYVLSHNITDKVAVTDLTNLIASVFEKQSKARFHSIDNNLFSGASASFNSTTDEMFKEVAIYHQRQIAEEELIETETEEIVLNNIDLVDIPTDNLIADKEASSSKEEKEEKIEKKEEVLRVVSYNILSSLDGIKHLVFIKYDNKKAEDFFQYGNIEDKIVKSTIKICKKYLTDIIELMENDEEPNSIKVSDTYQIIFVPIDETSFMYAIATNEIDANLMSPVFERIANRISKLVLDYKEEKAKK